MTPGLGTTVDVPSLQVRRIFKSYGIVPVLQDISFEVAELETFGVIGPNGAGKTTLFKVLTGEAPADSGSVFHRGADITDISANRRVRLGFGRTFQVARIFPAFTVIENVIAAIEARPLAPRSLRDRLRLRPDADVIAEAHAAVKDIGLDGKGGIEARYLSHGDKKRLEMAVTLALKPRVLMFDEPMAGMSPAERHETVDLIQRIRAENHITAMLVEHDMDVIFELADRIMVLNYGEVVALGTGEEIRADEAVRKVYLGEEMGDA